MVPDDLGPSWIWGGASRAVMEGGVADRHQQSGWCERITQEHINENFVISTRVRTYVRAWLFSAVHQGWPCSWRGACTQRMYCELIAQQRGEPSLVECVSRIRAARLCATGRKALAYEGVSVLSIDGYNTRQCLR
jgi:hypothetical protein